MNGNFITVRNNKRVSKVYVDEIIYIIRDRRRIKIVTDVEEYVFYEKMENITYLLSDNFFSSLKGCYVNLSKIKDMMDNRISFENGQELYLGNHSFIRTKQKYYIFLKMQETGLKKLAERMRYSSSCSMVSEENKNGRYLQ